MEGRRGQVVHRSYRVRWRRARGRDRGGRVDRLRVLLDFCVVGRGVREDRLGNCREVGVRGRQGLCDLVRGNLGHRVCVVAEEVAHRGVVAVVNCHGLVVVVDRGGEVVDRGGEVMDRGGEVEGHDVVAVARDVVVVDHGEGAGHDGMEEGIGRWAIDDEVFDEVDEDDYDYPLDDAGKDGFHYASYDDQDPCHDVPHDVHRDAHTSHLDDEDARGDRDVHVCVQ